VSKYYPPGVIYKLQLAWAFTCVIIFTDESPATLNSNYVQCKLPVIEVKSYALVTNFRFDAVYNRPALFR